MRTVGVGERGHTMINVEGSGKLAGDACCAVTLPLAALIYTAYTTSKKLNQDEFRTRDLALHGRVNTQQLDYEPRLKR